jgi:hypothetical protein
MENQLIGVSMKSRQDYNLVRNYIDVNGKQYSKPFQVLMGMIADYYSRDGTAEFVLPEVLGTQVRESLRNSKHVDLFDTLIAESAAAGHEANVRAAILAAKQQEVGDKLAVAITTGSPDTDQLMQEFKDLRHITSLDDLVDKGLEVYNNVDLAALMQHEFDPANLIKLYPDSLNSKLDGGVKRGHNITIFGRPESMKSGTAINISCGIARQNLKVLYFINEDPASSIIMRIVSNLTGMTKHQIQANPALAQRRAYDNGFENITVISCAPGTLGQLEHYLDQLQPDAFVGDQLRNFKVKADNRVNQLEYAATGVRNLGKMANCLAIGVTQAGDSADNKAVLEMGDVDFSNTGIPAAADLLLGVGVTPQLEAEGLRVFSMPKNKISGDHGSFPVRVIPQLSRVTSV